ncbi:hypothetical protein RSOLAG1IB_05037 [Rhizoctonia solani AG-1 IB]|uniref:DUF7605 domain-containing protein n=1 Tax=Thanatephorus cucumeris (strain AG1-IB / isolate 7/3/14) TaxID=1108050 RepID=A0A0B7FXL7_THACB|nr:hypothetical protein RSOLAG1IB_05037 [Rhizoctonia solani AG-1 IB]
MTREIAASWAQVFDSDLFAPMIRAERQEIANVLKLVQASAPPSLNIRCETQSQLALKESEVLNQNILQNLKTLMTSEQKNISRCLTPHVQKELLEAYQLAAAERGTGSVARQKKLFHDHIKASRGTIFSKGTNALFSKLDQAAEQIGVLLELGLNELAEKVEVSMSVLWDIPKAGNEETKRRRDLIQHLDDMLHQLELWLEACNAGIGNTFNRPATEIGANDFPGKDNGLVNLVMSNLLDGASVATLADNDEEHDTEGDEDDGEGDEEDELRDEEFDEGDPYYGMYY